MESFKSSFTVEIHELDFDDFLLDYFHQSVVFDLIDHTLCFYFSSFVY